MSEMHLNLSHNNSFAWAMGVDQNWVQFSILICIVVIIWIWIRQAHYRDYSQTHPHIKCRPPEQCLKLGAKYIIFEWKMVKYALQSFLLGFVCQVVTLSRLFFLTFSTPYADMFEEEKQTSCLILQNELLFGPLELDSFHIWCCRWSSFLTHTHSKNKYTYHCSLFCYALI